MTVPTPGPGPGVRPGPQPGPAVPHEPGPVEQQVSAALADLATLPVAEHVAVLDGVHQGLQEALATVSTAGAGQPGPTR